MHGVELDGAKPALPSQKLSAVLFLELSSPASVMIEAWLHEGNHLAAVVFYRQRWPKPLRHPFRWLRIRWSLLRVLRSHHVRLINMSSPDWQQLCREIERDKPDIGICFGFPRLIPDRIRSVFPHGVLNFHPALLPHYRGPKPLHWIALDNAWEQHGGMTLHEMTDQFDTGPIIAQAAMSDASNANDVRTFMEDAIATMLRRAVPRYCTGDLVAIAQPEGTYRYAAQVVPQPVVQATWTRHQLAMVLKVFGKRPGVRVNVAGGLTRLAAPVRSLGPATGQLPTAGAWSVAFDLADGRVSCRRYSKLGKQVVALVTALRPQRPRSDVPIRLGPNLQIEGRRSVRRP